jgi:hypothetical protein
MGRDARPFRLNVAAGYPEIVRSSTLPQRRSRRYERRMPARVRKLIGLFGILAFVVAYALVASKIADHLPNNMAIQTVFYVVVGLAWGVPILPLISWMNRGR